MLTVIEKNKTGISLFSPNTPKRRGQGSLSKGSLAQMNLVIETKFLPWMDKSSFDLRNVSETLQGAKEYLRERQEEVRPNTLRKEKAIISSFIAKSFPVNPKRIELELSEIKVPEMGTDKTGKAIPFDDLKTSLEEVSNPKHKLIMKALYYSGARISELINLKLREGKRSNDGEEILFHTIGKGNKDRLIRIPVSLYEEILISFESKNEKNSKGILFFNPRNKKGQFTRQALFQVTSLKGFSPHQLRHSRASHLIEDGISLNSVQKLLGHSSPMTTAKFYVHTHPKSESLKKRSL